MLFKDIRFVYTFMDDKANVIKSMFFWLQGNE